jgi:hypothetical protein
VIWNNGIHAVAFPFRLLMCHALYQGNGALGERPCVYCQLDSTRISEARFEQPENAVSADLPAEAEALRKMYAAFSQAASMNADQISDDEGDFFHEGRSEDSAVHQWDSVFQMPSAEQLRAMHESAEGQFEDAEDEDDTAALNGSSGADAKASKQRRLGD